MSCAFGFVLVVEHEDDRHSDAIRMDGDGQGSSASWCGYVGAGDGWGCGIEGDVRGDGCGNSPESDTGGNGGDCLGDDLLMHTVRLNSSVCYEAFDDGDGGAEEHQ